MDNVTAVTVVQSQLHFELSQVGHQIDLQPLFLEGLKAGPRSAGPSSVFTCSVEHVSTPSETRLLFCCDQHQMDCHRFVMCMNWHFVLLVIPKKQFSIAGFDLSICV